MTAFDFDSYTWLKTGNPARSENAQMFANRLHKNRKRLKKWLKQSGESCYRLYDADMPEFALAIDVYGDWVHVQEYAPPKSVDAAQAQKRLFDALGVIPEYQGKAVDSLLYRKLYEACYSPEVRVEINYVLEDNVRMNNAIYKLGAKPLRRYRVYQSDI